MEKSLRLPQSFYARGAQIVAQELLGKTLVHEFNGRRLAGLIVETEAYCDSDTPDLACHGHRANKGKPTPRTAVMFGPPGYVYVYFTYGNHWMFNIITGQTGQANGVLIRALQVTEGDDIISQHRAMRPQMEWANGPGKLAKALAINKSHHNSNLFAPDSVIWLEDTPRTENQTIASGPRIGLGKTPEPWLSIPWRYWIKDNPYVSNIKKSNP